MGMTRAEAEAYLAAQGIRNPSLQYSGATAVDQTRAARPDSSMPWIAYGAQVAPSLFPKEPSSVDKWMEATAKLQEARANKELEAMGVAPAAPAASLWDSIFGASSPTATAPVVSAAAPTAPVASAASAAVPATTASSATPAASASLWDSVFGAGSSASPSIASSVLPAAGIAAGAYTGYQQIKGVENALRNKPMDFQQQAALALPTFGASFLYNPVRKFFGSGKGKEQVARDSYRSSMRDSGLIDKDYLWTDTTGKKFDFGLDGKKQNYNVDFSRPGVSDVVAGANPLAMILTGQGGKLRSDLAGQITNAVMGSGDANANLNKIYADAGFNHDSAYGRIHEMQQKGLISQEDGDQAKNALDKQFRVGAYAPKQQRR